MTELHLSTPSEGTGRDPLREDDDPSYGWYAAYHQRAPRELDGRNVIQRIRDTIRAAKQFGVEIGSDEGSIGDAYAQAYHATRDPNKPGILQNLIGREAREDFGTAIANYDSTKDPRSRQYNPPPLPDEKYWDSGAGLYIQPQNPDGAQTPEQ